MSPRAASPTSSRQYRFVPYPVYEPDTFRLANELAIAMCRQALKAGKMRLVNPNHRASSVYLPRMDILDDPSSTHIVATFELPGVRSDQLALNIHDGIMHVQGRRLPRTVQEHRMNRNPQSNGPRKTTATTHDDDSSCSSVESKKYPVQELRYGLFKREVKLSKGVKEDEVTALLKDGLLIVTWPRAPMAYPDTPLPVQPLGTDDSKTSASTAKDDTQAP
ncbi:hypothetical protein AX17_001682 [Amanita inopinata Kibby_2008]|nr:hypothetical protein AX17_001682 [Amanita inopinata Kibby_2008]